MKPTGRYLRGGGQCPICGEGTSLSDHGKTSFYQSRGRKVFTCENPQCPSADAAFWINGEKLTEKEYSAWVRDNQRQTK